MAELTADVFRPVGRAQGPGGRAVGGIAVVGPSNKAQVFYELPVTVPTPGGTVSIAPFKLAQVWQGSAPATITANVTQIDLSQASGSRWYTFTLNAAGGFYLCKEGDWQAIATTNDAIRLEYIPRGSVRRAQPRLPLVLAYGTLTVWNSRASDRALSLWNGSSPDTSVYHPTDNNAPPVGWETNAFVDSVWPHAMQTFWHTFDPNKIWPEQDQIAPFEEALFRLHGSLPASAISYARLSIATPGGTGGEPPPGPTVQVFINGHDTGLRGFSAPFDIPFGWLNTGGADNVVALHASAHGNVPANPLEIHAFTFYQYWIAVVSGGPPPPPGLTVGANWAGHVCTVTDELVCLTSFTAVANPDKSVTLTATVDTDLNPTIWWLLIVDEFNTVLAFAGGGTSRSFTVGPYNVASHTYRAYLSVSSGGIATHGPADPPVTGPITVYWF